MTDLEVVDTEQQTDGLGRELDSRRRDEERLEDVFFQDVRDRSLQYVNKNHCVSIRAHQHTFQDPHPATKGEEEERKKERRKGGRTLRTLIPAVISPLACLFLSSVTIAMGFSPAFSARVVGMTSSASAKAWKQ
jgi:hypothetical protein